MARLFALLNHILRINQLRLGIQHSMSLRSMAAECSRWREPAVLLATVLEPAPTGDR
jgi:hypothetical protein